MTTTVQRLRERLDRDPRLARVLQGGVSGFVTRVLTVLVNLITLPLTLHYLGQIEYGVWVTISTSVLLLSALDFGIANTLTTFIAEASAKEDRQKARYLFTTALWVTVGVVVILAPLFFLAWRSVPWGGLFHLANPTYITHASQCAGVAILFFLLSLPLALGARVLGGYQQVHIANYFVVCGAVLSLAAIVFIILLHGTLVHLMLAYSGSNLLASLALNIWLFFRWPWLRPSPRHIRRHTVRRLFGQGMLFFVLQLTVLVVFNSDNLVISHYLGAASVTPYSTAWRLTQYAAAMQAFIVPALWPAFTEAYRKRELAWVIAQYQSLQRKTLLVVGSAALLFALGGKLFIRIWAGPSAVPSQRLIWIMAAFAFVMALTSTQALLLTATGRLRLETGVAVLAAISNLILSIWLVQRIGVDGVILATLFSFVVFMLVPQQWEVSRVLRGHYLNSE
jgi:O-antigen/teichoic acid export membrane protein